MGDFTTAGEVESVTAHEVINNMEQSRQEYEKPFTQEEELNEKVARLNELNVQLDLENGKTEDVDLCETQDNARVAEPGTYHCFPSGKEGR